jgi:hypothetical protein
MMPGARYARALMILVAIVVSAGLIVGVVAAPGMP